MSTSKSCISCGLSSKDIPLVFVTPSARVAKCPSCGLAWTDDSFEDMVLADEVGYWGQAIYEEHALQFQQEATSYLDLISRYKNGVRLLDIGCGVGFFLASAEQMGWEATGLDVSVRAVRQAQRRLNQGSVIASTVADAEFPTSYFDVITLWSALEHMAHPAQSLDRILTWLKPDGIIALEVPIEDSLLKTLNRWMYKLSGGRFHAVHYLYGNAPGSHIWSFSKKSLRLLFRQHGLQRLHIERRNSTLGVLLAKYQTDRGLFRRAVKFTAMATLNTIATLTRHQNKLIIVFGRYP